MIVISRWYSLDLVDGYSINKHTIRRCSAQAYARLAMKEAADSWNVVNALIRGTLSRSV